MSTTLPKPKSRRKPWPHVAAHARNQAAEAAISGIREINPLLSGRAIDPSEVTRRVAVTSNRLHQIAFLLKSVGAEIDYPEYPEG